VPAVGDGCRGRLSGTTVGRLSDDCRTDACMERMQSFLPRGLYPEASASCFWQRPIAPTTMADWFSMIGGLPAKRAAPPAPTHLLAPPSN